MNIAQKIIKNLCIYLHRAMCIQKGPGGAGEHNVRPFALAQFPR